MSPRTLKMLLAGLGVGTLAVVTLACGSQEVDEPAEDVASPTVEQAAPSPPPPPTVPPTTAPSPEPTATQAPSTTNRSSIGDPRKNDGGALNVTSVVVDGREYEVAKILSQDAIPAIFNPNFYTPEEAEHQYRETDLVIGVSIGDEHRAYHVAYLSGHEIVNDVVGGKPIAVTW
ncbi:MAG: DUF3179 domain-containing protein [Dehalococcoidia bacterium]|nr:DUF3179 domain-containing protein [Dehalococcoidia bacterium]